MKKQLKASLSNFWHQLLVSLFHVILKSAYSKFLFGTIRIKTFKIFYWSLLLRCIHFIILLVPQLSMCCRELLLDFYNTSNRKPTQIIVFRYYYVGSVNFRFEREKKEVIILRWSIRCDWEGRAWYSPWPSRTGFRSHLEI